MRPKDGLRGRSPWTAVSRLAEVLAAIVALRQVLRRRGRRGGGERGGPPALSPESSIDPSERRVPPNRRAETLVAGLLVLAALFGFGFTAVYVAASMNTQLLGVAFGGALVLLAAAAIIAGKFVVPQETSVEERDVLLDEELTEEVVELVESGGEGISRRVLLVGAGGLAGTAIVTAAATPLASLGPTLGHIHDTPWQKGVRLVDDQGRPYAAADIEIGSFYTALPEQGNLHDLGAGLIVVKLPGDMLHLPAARQNWAPHGILAFSKICTHAGCAISLYRYPTYEPTSESPAFTCPCHYSSFSPGEGGRVIFGPAGRALPQLPLMIDPDGMLRAAGVFDDDGGPSWWDVRRA